MGRQDMYNVSDIRIPGKPALSLLFLIASVNITALCHRLLLNETVLSCYENIYLSFVRYLVCICYIYENMYLLGMKY